MATFNFGGTDTSGGFNFGAPATGGGAAPAFDFGASATNTAAATTTNAFGFGAATDTTGAGGGFNFNFAAPATTNAAAGTTGGFDFGFGANNATTNNAANNNFGFGATTNNNFGFSAPAASPQQQNGQFTDSPDPKLAQLMQAYHLPSPQCKFQFMFYNKMDPKQVASYQQRPNNANPRLWKQAERNNPDRNTLVVCQARGFIDLKKRIQQQEKASQVYQKKLQDVQRIIIEMKQQHEATTKISIAAFRRKHLELSHRLLCLMNRIQQNRARGSFLVPEEVSFYKNLASIKRELARPAQFQARVREIESTVRMQEERPMETAHFVSADNLMRIKTFLEMQRKALKFLTDVLQKDLRDLDILVDGLRAVPSRGVQAGVGSGGSSGGMGGGRMQQIGLR